MILLVKKRNHIFIQLKLEPEQTGLNFKVKVISIEKAVDETLSDGSRWARALAVVSDSTGCVVLIAINEQIEKLEAGKNYYLLNAKAVMFHGWMRIEIDEWGAINHTNEDVTSNTKKNVSNIEYELVGSDDDDE